jgi:hypothetical protein
MRKGIIRILDVVVSNVKQSAVVYAAPVPMVMLTLVMIARVFADRYCFQLVLYVSLGVLKQENTTHTSR